MITLRLATHVLAAVVTVVLSGCGDSGIPDLKQWMAEARARSKVTVSPIPEPKKFAPFVYSARTDIDPYNPVKLSAALAKQQPNSTSNIKPDLQRRRESLESYPLDTVTMVGTLQKPGLSFALLQADKVIFQAKVGNYVGQNFGMITRITETEVELKEIVRDASGEWVERKAKLELQENKK